MAIWRYMLILLLTMQTLSAVSVAEKPTKKAIDAMYDFFSEGGSKPAYDWLEDMHCFQEHMCASGPIGSDSGCELNVSNCLAAAYDPEHSFHTPLFEGRASTYDEVCLSFFARLTERQHQMIATPKNCSMPPPLVAVQPTFSPNEARCLAPRLCGNPYYSDADTKRCVDDYYKCTKDLSTLSAFGRWHCRSSRRTVSGGPLPWLGGDSPDSCDVEMAAPRLWSPDQSRTVDWNDPPRTWQEQVEIEDSGPVGDFDLGDLNF